MIVDENKGMSGLEPLKRIEDERMPIARNNRTDIDKRIHGQSGIGHRHTSSLSDIWGLMECLSLPPEMPSNFQARQDQVVSVSHADLS